jgi:hypothetical protein
MPVFGLMCVVVAVGRLRWVCAFVLVNVTFLPVEITAFVISRPAVLCARKH